MTLPYLVRKFVFMMSVAHFLNILLPVCVLASSGKPPNVVLIMADDLGWNDVSFHGYSQIPTPNIDRLASEGMILNSHYSHCACTPSRVALLTGKYPMRLGLQSGVLGPGDRLGIPLKEKLVPEYFRELGYATHMIGKWHVGYAVPEMTPTYRGFDSFLGYYNGFIDYYRHHIYDSQDKFSNGYDLSENGQPTRNYTGRYLTDLFTEKALNRIDGHDFDQPLFLYLAHMAPHWANEDDPVQSPDIYTARFKHIQHEGRRKYAGTIAALDDSVGKIVNALRKRKVDDSTVIVFVADNGGSGQEVFCNDPGGHGTYGSNWPLRSAKGTWFEGGIRTVGIVWSRQLKHPGTVWNGMTHLTDWLPTLMTAAGGIPVRNIDGVDQWPSLVNFAPSIRNELLIQASAQRGQYALRWYQYKLIVHERPVDGCDSGDYWYEPADGLNASYVNTDLPAVLRCDPPRLSDRPCKLGTTPCLFDVQKDPCERNNIMHDYPDVTKIMLEKLWAYNASGMHPVRPPKDPLGLPVLNGWFIAPWLNMSDLPEFLLN